MYFMVMETMGVLPARAGVILIKIWSISLQECPSRASGGDPRKIKVTNQTAKSFPRERG